MPLTGSDAGEGRTAARGRNAMAVERTYKCDLCRDTYAVDDARLVGILWTDRVFIYAPSRNVEHHLCANCIGSAVRLAREANQNGHSVKY
jgi:hypothetical protein